MSTFGYIRVSKDTQDIDNQRHAILEYAHTHKIQINRFITVESSSTKSQFNREITTLLSLLKPGDKIIVTELSRLARNMLETMNLIEKITKEYLVNIIFVFQPELSTDADHVGILRAIYGYIAEAERKYISRRTKSALAARKAKGIQLGRPKGAKNVKPSPLIQYKAEIENYLAKGVSLNSVKKILDDNFTKPPSYNTYREFVKTNISSSKEYNKQLDL